MLICNIIKHRVDQLTSEQYGGKCKNNNSLFELLINQFNNTACNVDIPCTDAVIPCNGTSTVNCALSTVQNLTSTTCSISIVQTFDDP